MNPVTSELQKEDQKIQICDKLRKDNVKLWLQPYYSDLTGPSFVDLKNLADEISNSLKIPTENSYEILQKVQNLALENLKQANRYKESGLATIQIKVLHPNSPPRLITKELLLSLRGIDLKDLISKEINVPPDKLKLIYSGKVLTDTNNLSSQEVKHGKKILAVTFNDSPLDLKEAETSYSELEGFKSDSRLLALDDEYMQLEDQFGNVVRVPKEEKKSLIVAMTLHEKGRAALKKEDYSRALVFFLGADEEFRMCNSTLLDSVDNYALLDLDITWCYLCLQSLINLPEAFERLKRCEQRFHMSYGPNLERLMAVKGATGNEAALFMRLHLLQAVVLYHKNKRSEALTLFRKVEEELSGLKVDDASISLLVELGFTPAEARLGLRASGGDVNMAANYIKENRDKRAQSRHKTLTEEILKNKRLKLGKCVDGKQYVDPQFVKILVKMGYNKEAARVALQQCNNIISDSVQYIQEHPQAGPSQSRSMEFLALINDLTPELEAAGFDPYMAKLALHKHSGDIMKAAEDLLANNGMVYYDDYSVLNLSTESLEAWKKKVEDKEQAFKRIAEDITMVDDDHLDLNLIQEEAFLNQYLTLLDNE